MTDTNRAFAKADQATGKSIISGLYDNDMMPGAVNQPGHTSMVDLSPYSGDTDTQMGGTQQYQENMDTTPTHQQVSKQESQDEQDHTNNTVQEDDLDDKAELFDISKVNDALSKIRDINKSMDKTDDGQQKKQLDGKEDDSIDKTMEDTYSTNKGIDQSIYNEVLERNTNLEKDLRDSNSQVNRLKLQIEDMQSILDDLREESVNLSKKAQKAEIQNKTSSVPDDLRSLVRYYIDSQDADERYAAQSKEGLKSELVRMVEKMYGRSLNDYIGDAMSYGDTPISGGSFSQYQPNNQVNRQQGYGSHLERRISRGT